MRILIPCFCFFLSFFWSSCEYNGNVVSEGNDRSFERGRSYLKVGREEEALDEFLSVTRRITHAPKSHLQAGRLLLNLNERKDPVAAIYHFRRFLLLQPNSREFGMVQQLIVTAEREILRELPGEPYGNYLESLKLKEENDYLKRQIADLEARLGTSPILSDPVTLEPTQQDLFAKDKFKPTKEVSNPRTYVVEPGDSLYGISKKIYGDSSHIDAIFQANRNTLKSKNSLRVGQTLNLPSVP